MDPRYNKRLNFCSTSDDDDEMDLLSPHHTRSGRVYSRTVRRSRPIVKQRVEDGDMADCEEGEEEVSTVDSLE